MLFVHGAHLHGWCWLLFIAERTVETHTTQIFQKLGLSASSDTHRRVLAVLAYLRSTD